MAITRADVRRARRALRRLACALLGHQDENNWSLMRINGVPVRWHWWVECDRCDRRSEGIRVSTSLTFEKPTQWQLRRAVWLDRLSKLRTARKAGAA